MKKLIILCLVLTTFTCKSEDLSPSNNTNENCNTKICTEIFVTASVTILNLTTSDTHLIANPNLLDSIPQLDTYYTILGTDTFTIKKNTSTTLYDIINDSYKHLFQCNLEQSIQFVGFYQEKKVIDETYTFISDGCHIKKTKGLDTIIIVQTRDCKLQNNICTKNFVTHTITILDNNDNPVILDTYYTLNKNDTLSIIRNYFTPNTSGIYPVIDDSHQHSLACYPTPLQFIGLLNNQQIINKEFYFSSDGCHIIKDTTEDTIIVSIP